MQFINTSVDMHCVDSAQDGRKYIAVSFGRTEWVSECVGFNSLKGSGVRWLHFEVFSAIQV